MTLGAAASRADNIRHSLLGMKMSRALERLDATLRRIEQGRIDGIEALDELLLEELSLRENRRIEAALRMARLSVIETLAGFDFSFQPSLDRNRIMALAGLDFIGRAEVVHHQGPLSRSPTCTRAPIRASDRRRFSSQRKLSLVSIGTRVGLILRLSAAVPLNSSRVRNFTAGADVLHTFYDNLDVKYVLGNSKQPTTNKRRSLTAISSAPVSCTTSIIDVSRRVTIGAVRPHFESEFGAN